MPHQCVRCGEIYEDASEELLKGCSCGSKVFFYIKKENLEKKKEEVFKLTKKEKEQIEEDVYDLIGDKIDREKPVVLDIESINILKPGKYEIDIVSLFGEQPLIYKLDEGKYIVDLVKTFRNMDKSDKYSKK